MSYIVHSYEAQRSNTDNHPDDYPYIVERKKLHVEHGEHFLVSGVKWSDGGVHEVMIFRADATGEPTDWSERYCKRNTTDVLQVWHDYLTHKGALLRG